MERVLGFQHSMLLLAEPAGDALVVAATRGYARPGTDVRVRIGDGVIGVVAERRTPMRVGNIGASVRYLLAIRARMQAAGQEIPEASRPACRACRTCRASSPCPCSSRTA